jgi:DNA-directed RNA polymerase
MIHDSFGTYASDIDGLNLATRLEFVEMYKGDTLRGLYDEFIGQLPDEVGKQLPEPPEMGDLDIQGVMLSDYFFA